MSHHMAAHEDSLNYMRRNIDAWWPYIESGAEAVIVSASGCGAVIKDYGKLFKHDDNYADKAEKVSALCRDISEVLAGENLAPLTPGTKTQRVAFHSPCTLQHGQQITGVVEKILQDTGFELTQVSDGHLCCGSAGTYSLLQPELSEQLLTNKLASLQAESPEIIVTANIGCQMHLSTQAGVPVKHWIELLDN